MTRNNDSYTAKQLADIIESDGYFDATYGEDDLALVLKALRAYDESSGPSGHVSTHWDGCGKEGGRRHYECLLHDYERLERELNAALQDLPTATKEQG